MEAGERIAYAQLPVIETTLHADELPRGKATFSFRHHDGGSLTVTGDGVEITFSGKSGFMNRYIVNGIPMLCEGGSLRPNFWRAVTDNDMGAWLQQKLKVWRNPVIELTSMAVDRKASSKSQTTVVACYDLPDVDATLTLTYEIHRGGAMCVTQGIAFNDTTRDVPEMLRFGMVMDMPRSMEVSHFYGRGPIENYADRRYSQRLGIYRQTADEQFYPYIRPQETGTKGDIRWWLQTDTEGNGIKITADKPFYASALHYDIATLDEGDEKHQRHPSDLVKLPYTILTLDSEHCGVGGIDSWGARPLERYRLPAIDRTCSFTLTPTINRDQIEISGSQHIVPHAGDISWENKMEDLIDLLSHEKFSERTMDKWELLMKHSDGCVSEYLATAFSDILHKHPQEVLMSIYNHRVNPPTGIIDNIKFMAHELGEDPSIDDLRQYITKLPDASARDYLTQLFEL